MTGHEDEAGRAREEAAWQDIVDAYGDRPEFPDLVVTEPEPVVPEPVPDEVAYPAELRSTEPGADPGADWEDEGHYVPPPPPPLPRIQGPRGLAWVGLFGIPAVMLVLLMLHVRLPSPLPLLILAAFVGSFGYLVATMGGNDPDSGWDDGAVL